MASCRLNKALPDSPRTLLVPVSGGVSSVILLYILDEQVRRQRLKSQNRVFYNLHVLVVGTSLVASDSPSQSWAESLKKRFPIHTHTFTPLSAIFEYDSNILEALQRLGFSDSPSSNFANEQKLQSVFSRISSPTARVDFTSILLSRFVGAFANAHGLEHVLWGHCDSKLAATALSSVAKGRGGSVPTQICDGPSVWGPIFIHPLREVFKLELELYSQLIDPLLSEMVIQNNDNEPSKTSIKNSAIDNLLTAYISSQGQKYPSIMANVVRTSSKLQEPQDLKQSMPCSFCGASTLQDPGFSCSTSPPLKSNVCPDLCYGCLRLRQEL